MEEKPLGTPNPLNPNLGEASLDRSSSKPLQPMDAQRPIEPAQKSTYPTDSVSQTNTAKLNHPKPINHMKPIDMVRPARPIDMVRPMSPRTAPHNDAVTNTFAAEPEMSSSLVSEPDASLTPQRPDFAPTLRPKPSTPRSRPVTHSPQSMNNLGVVTNIDGTPTGKIDPASRPMAKVTTPEDSKPKNKKKRKRTKLFVAMVISLFIAIGCGVTAVLIMLNGPKDDMVAVAMNRLISGNGPANIMVDGTINIKAKNANSTITDLNISVGTEAVLKSKINSTIVNLKINLKDGKNVSADISEIYAANGDLYLKVNGAKELLDNFDALKEMKVSGQAAEEMGIQKETLSSEEAGSTMTQGAQEATTTQETTTTQEAASTKTVTLGSILEVIDNEWIRIPLNDFQTALALNMTGNKEMSCLVNLFGDINNYENTLSGIYLKSPFVTSTDENLAVASERDPIHKIIINEQNLRAFINESANTNAVNNLTDCLGQKNSTNDADKLIKMVQNLPDIYAEVNDDANFTRLFIDTDTKDATIKADFKLSYPDSVIVPEPVNYKEFHDIIGE